MLGSLLLAPMPTRSATKLTQRFKKQILKIQFFSTLIAKARQGLETRRVSHAYGSTAFIVCTAPPKSVPSLLTRLMPPGSEAGGATATQVEKTYLE
jgi:hypothetical protein